MFGHSCRAPPQQRHAATDWEYAPWGHKHRSRERVVRVHHVPGAVATHPGEILQRSVHVFPPDLRVLRCQMAAIGFDEAYPLWAVSTVDVGGLGWTPEHIGKVNTPWKASWEGEATLSLSAYLSTQRCLPPDGLCRVSCQEDPSIVLRSTVAQFTSSLTVCILPVCIYIHRRLSGRPQLLRALLPTVIYFGTRGS